jgi:hypothetical protein
MIAIFNARTVPPKDGVERIVRRRFSEGGSETHRNVRHRCYVMGFAMLNPSYMLEA